MRYSSGAWTPEDDGQAYDEGWGIFHTGGEPGHAELELQYDQDLGVFDDDEDAWRHVLQRWSEGSALHRRALLHLELNSPLEHQMLLDFWEDMQDERT